MSSQIVLIALLIVLSAFLAASEAAITSANKIRLKHKAENGSAPAKKALEMIGDFDKALSAILIGNHIVNITAATISALLTLKLLPEDLHEYAAALSTAIIALLVLTLGEVLPKSIARLHAESFCMTFSGAIRFWMILLAPLSAFFLLLQNNTSNIFNKGKREVSVTEEELIQIIEDIEDEGVLEEQESSLVRQALVFDETTAGEILTPRVNIVAVPVLAEKDFIRELFLSEGYSRIPVYEKSIDHICGILNIKDFMRKYYSGKDFSLPGVVQEALFIPALMKLSEVLKLMQKEKLHMAVVIDQYGGTQGIVTLEDILEELVGEIFDEDDEVTAPITFTSETTFEVSGHLSKNDFNRYFENKGMNFEILSDSKTVGGWVYELFGKIPETNDMVKTPDFAITVLSIQARVIELLRFEILK